MNGGTFVNCSSLVNIHLGQNYIIEPYSFQNCTSLESFSIPKITYIRTCCFQNCINLKHVECNSIIDIFERYAFDGCISLLSFDFQQRFNSIDCFAFRGCTSLTSVTFSEAGTIMAYAFDNCINLKTINATSIYYLDPKSFNNCIKLSQVIYLGYKSPDCFGGDVFYNCNVKYVTVFDNYIHKAFCDYPAKLYRPTEFFSKSDEFTTSQVFSKV